MRKPGIGKALSWLLGCAVMAMMVFAIASNFVIIAQSTISPLSPVMGNSMYPHIKDGDAVLVIGGGKENLRVGEVVVFPDPENPEQSVVHRVIALEEKRGSTYAVTKGDANPTADPFEIPLSRVSGTVKLVIPHGGTFIEYLRSPRGYITCVITPLLLLALYLLARRYLESPEQRKGLLARELIPQSR